MKKYIVCDACYMVHDEDYDKILMPLWFPPGLNVAVNDFQAYGGEFTIRSKFSNPALVAQSEWHEYMVNFLRYMSTHGWDCVIDWLGCDAGNFSVFEIDCDEKTWLNFLNNKRMFRVFDTQYQAIAFLEMIIAQS